MFGWFSLLTFHFLVFTLLLSSNQCKRLGFAGAVGVYVGGGKPGASQCKINMDGRGAIESRSSVLPSAHATMCVEPHRWLLSLSRLFRMRTEICLCKHIRRQHAFSLISGLDSLIDCNT